MQIENVYIETYGCSANQNNAEIISGILRQAGLFIVKNIKIADFAILNTCIVKGPTKEKMLSRVKEIGKKFGARFIVSGCMPDVFSKEILQIAPNSSFVGSHHVKNIANAVKKISQGKKVFMTGKINEPKLCLPKIPSSSVIGITQILEGCVGKCTYCITRQAKGELFSYPKEEIIKNIKNDLANGCKEIWLTSQDNAAYGLESGKYMLPVLLKEILSLKGKFYVRLGMMNPNHVLPFLDELIECYRDEKFFKFLHIPIQSGSNKVLKEMKRGYSKENFTKIVNSFRKEFPTITVSTDIIVAYPTESKDDFDETVELIKKIRPQILNLSRFWPMKNTEASGLKRINAKESKKRAKVISELHLGICKEESAKMLGWNGKAIVDKHGFEDTFLARNKDYNLIAVNGKNILGKFVDVEIVKTSPHYLYGKIVEDN
ncbi:MAG: tRNA (N(6)-L-threonylcarbamoyladenosine(37)-C(2))-methylthiotransferase [archaeon]